jgi:hypothetical protein
MAAMSAAEWDALMGRLLFAGWLLFALALGWLAAGEPTSPTGTALDVLPPKKNEEDDRR